MLEITLESRACECCGGTDLEELWSSSSVVKRAVNDWRFPFHVAVCKACGFCFASPGPKAGDLARYYAEGLSGHKEIGLPYSVDPRIEVLERFRAPEGVFAEIGGDQPGEFHRRSSALFARQLVVEVADDSPADARSVHDLEASSVDVIAHYDVLEHVVDVKGFLSSCRTALKPGGVMICETPNLRLYPRNLLLLESEHVNHFSPATLAAIASQVGLELVEIGHLCSRPYGFLAIFRKGNPRTDLGLDRHAELVDARACVRGGLEQIRRVNARIAALRGEIAALGSDRRNITLWGVTDFLRRLIEDFVLPSTAVVVDVDPRRRDHLRQNGIEVLQPKDCVEHIANSDLLVICAPRYKSDIVEWVQRTTGKTLMGSTLAVLGSGPSGETLN
jgi:SAM-dependent methyltransferase